VAYLFNTNGTLLLVITNPIPKSGASFGEAVATVGDGVLLGARYADPSGVSYLFNTNGLNDSRITTFYDSGFNSATKVLAAR